MEESEVSGAVEASIPWLGIPGMNPSNELSSCAALASSSSLIWVVIAKGGLTWRSEFGMSIEKVTTGPQHWTCISVSLGLCSVALATPGAGIGGNLTISSPVYYGRISLFDRSMQLSCMTADIHGGLALDSAFRAVALLAKTSDVRGKWG